MIMPGVESCLHRHEWYKHGSCSGLAPKDYYALSVKLALNFSKTRFNDFVSRNAGGDVERRTLLNEFDREFGRGSSSYLELKCEWINGVALLTEIRIYLQNSLNTSHSLKELFPKNRMNIKGSCPKRFRIDEAGLGNYFKWKGHH
jgi:ribonuclease I